MKGTESVRLIFCTPCLEYPSELKCFIVSYDRCRMQDRSGFSGQQCCIIGQKELFLGSKKECMAFSNNGMTRRRLLTVRERCSPTSRSMMWVNHSRPNPSLMQSVILNAATLLLSLPGLCPTRLYVVLATCCSRVLVLLLVTIGHNMIWSLQLHQAFVVRVQMS